MTPTLPLRLAFLGNGIFSFLCALPMVVFCSELSEDLGIAVSVLWGLGALVGLNALFLMEYALTASSSRLSLWSAVGGDVLWVLGSVLALFLFGSQLTQSGLAAVISVAIVVGYFGMAQARELLRLEA